MGLGLLDKWFRKCTWCKSKPVDRAYKHRGKRILVCRKCLAQAERMGLPRA